MSETIRARRGLETRQSGQGEDRRRDDQMKEGIGDKTIRARRGLETR